jgi:hypothetical protein
MEDLALTFLETQTPGSRSAYFTRNGAEIPDRVRSISFVERYLDIHDITNTGVSFVWTGNTVGGVVEVSLRDSGQ